MGEYAETWEAYKKLVDEHDRGDMKRQAEIEPKLHELVKKLESLAPKDQADAAAKKEHDNWDGSSKLAKPVLNVTPKTGDVLKDIDTAIKGSNPPPKAGSSSGGSSGI